ncbi:hypothetical protein Tco_0168131 [Tanacetum coccineum]
MSQPANDEFSQHLSDEESNHEDASDTGAAPKQQQQVIPQTTAISNIKLPILKKEEYDIWAMDMEHYLEYIDNEVWKKFKLLKRKGRLRYLDMAIPKEHIKIHGRMMQNISGNIIEKEHRVFEKESSRLQKHLQCSNVAFVSQSKSSTNKVKSGFTGAYSTCTRLLFNQYSLRKEILTDIEEMDINWQIADCYSMKKCLIRRDREGEEVHKGPHDGKKKRDSLYQHQEAGKQEKNQMGLLTMDDGIEHPLKNMVDRVIPEEKAASRKSSTNSKKEEILTELQQEKKAFSTDTSEDNPKIQALEETVYTGRLEIDDSPMPELEIFHKSKTGIFDEASYDERHSMDVKMKGRRAKVLAFVNLRTGSSFYNTSKSSGEEQMEDKSPNTHKAANSLQDTAKKAFNTSSIKLSTVSEQVSTGNEQVSTVSAKRSTPSPDKGQRAGKAPMIIEETPKKIMDMKVISAEEFSFEEVKEEFDKLVKQVESFAPINFEATKASLKRFGEELQTKTSKRLKSDEAKDDDQPSRLERRKQCAEERIASRHGG